MGILGNLPQVTKNLLIINVLVYLLTLFLESQGTPAYDYLSAHYFNSPKFRPVQIISHMFMHGSGMHIFFNMFLLVMFGGHLERVWGAKRYFIFYFAAGLGALVLYNSIGVFQLFDLREQLMQLGYNMDTTDFFIEQNRVQEIMVLGDSLPQIQSYYNLSMQSMVGASGALFGLLAAFAMLFPNTELMLLFPPIPIKAKYLIGGYIVFEIYSSLYQSAGDHIAHLAHVGGAVVGVIFILIWRRKDRKNFW